MGCWYGNDTFSGEAERSYTPIRAAEERFCYVSGPCYRIDPSDPQKRTLYTPPPQPDWHWGKESLPTAARVGRPSKYATPAERYEARKARERERYATSVGTGHLANGGGLTLPQRNYPCDTCKKACQSTSTNAKYCPECSKQRNAQQRRDWQRKYDAKKRGKK